MGALTEDTPFEFEVVPDQGYTTDEAYALLAGLGPNTSELPAPQTAAGFNPRQLRDWHGRWEKLKQSFKPASSGDKFNFIEHLGRVERAVSESHKALSTENTHTYKGAWLPERDKLHRQIVDDLYKQAANVPNQGRAIMLGGPAGAGKSTVLEGKLRVKPGSFLVINPDDIKEELARRNLVPEIPGYDDLSPMDRTTLVHRESVRIADMLADRAYRDRKNLIWDTTMTRSDLALYRIKRMRQSGYDDIRGVFVNADDHVAIQRVRARYMRGAHDYSQGKGLGGRFVPQAIQDQMSTGETRASFKYVRRYFDDWKMYDNSGSSPRLHSEKN